MKKLCIVLAALLVSAAVVSAQDREINLDKIEDLNKREITKPGSNVKVDLAVAFPMYFGWTAWNNSNSAFNTRTGKNFVYGLEIAGVHFKSANGGPLDVSLGLRWTFMDFTFSDPTYTLRRYEGYGYGLYSIKQENDAYDFNKSKFHASYFGIPLRVKLNFGHAAVFAGASAELLTSGYTKYKHPNGRMQIKDAFNPFRASIEAGFMYGIIGVYVQYGLTPVLKDLETNARTLTFGLVLGL